jgi:hypothetical protein
VIAAAPATLDPAPRTCDMCVTAGKDGRVAAVELISGKKKGARAGASGQMHIHSARGISDNGALVGDDG